MTKNGQNKPPQIPWFIRSEDTTDLVYRYDPAVSKFPDQDLDVAPIKMCKIKRNKKPAVFRVRPLTNREHIGLASISIKGLQEDSLQEQYLAAAFEIAQMCVEEAETPTGDVWDHEKWKAEIENAHPGLVIGLGLWVLQESTWDPTKSKDRPPPRQTLHN